MNQRLEHAMDLLKTNGIRMTPQRSAILSILLDSNTHPTADDIYRSLEGRFPSMSVATVYNNLKVFIGAGLIKELTYGDARSRFDANTEEHYHAQCVSCGKIEEFTFPSLGEVEGIAAQSTSYQVHGHRLEVQGLCKDCAAAATASSSQALAHKH